MYAMRVLQTAIKGEAEKMEIRSEDDVAELVMAMRFEGKY